MTTLHPILFAIILIVLVVSLLLAPVTRYVWVGWRAKRKDIMDGLNSEARLAYFQMFSRSSCTVPNDVNDAQAAFEKLYTQWYGRRYFFAPAILLLITALAATALVTFTVLHGRGYIVANPLFDIPETAIAAIAGAYLWVANDHISRARRLDFSPADVMWGVLRIVIAVPMGYAFASVAAKDVGPFVAFGLGAFPLGAITQMLQKLTNKALKTEETADEAHDNIIELQGINKTIVERLANEDITTVTQVAYCDPVRLTMRSNLTFNFITDCMNQALAWMYLEDDLKLLRPLGMRGAVEIKLLIDDFDNGNGTGTTEAEKVAARSRAVAAFPKLAAAVKQDPETLQVAFRQISEDPFTDFLTGVWAETG